MMIIMILMMIMMIMICPRRGLQALESRGALHLPLRLPADSAGLRTKNIYIYIYIYIYTYDVFNNINQ